MRLSAWVSIGDLVQQKKNFFERFIIGRFIYQSIFNRKNPSRVLLTLKKAGVDGIELLLSSNASDNDLERINQMMQKLNMHIFSIHQPLSTLFNIKISKIKNLCQIAKKLSAEVLVLHTNVIGDQIFNDNYAGSLKALETQYNIKIAIENMPKSPLSIFKTYCWKEKEFLSLIKKTGFYITFDITHLAQTGKDIISFYKNSKDHIINIHLSDYKKHFLNTHLLLTNHTHLPLGYGNLPIKEFLQVLKKTNYNGLVTMEINGNLKELCQSARFIRSHLAYAR